MENDIFSSIECGSVFAALCIFQAAVEPPKKSKTATVKGRTRTGSEYEYKYAYAPLEEIHRTVQKPMADAKLAHRQSLVVRDGAWVMRTVVVHESGQWYGCDYPVIFDETRGAQGFASGVTYSRRYGLMLALGIVGEDDDDANVADGNVATIAPKRRTQMEVMSTPPDDRTIPRRAPYTAPPAAPQDDAKDYGRRLYREMRERLASAASVDFIDIHTGPKPSPEWVEMCRVLTEIDPVGSDNIITTMRELADTRRREIEERGF